MHCAGTEDLGNGLLDYKGEHDYVVASQEFDVPLCPSVNLVWRLEG